MAKKFGAAKSIIYSLIPLALFLIVIELSLNIIFAIKKVGKKHTFATLDAYKKINTLLTEQRLRRKFAEVFDKEISAENIAKLEPIIVKKIYSKPYSNLLNKYHMLYREKFHELTLEVKNVDALLIVIYVPSFVDAFFDSEKQEKLFFEKLSNDYDVPFFDFASIFEQYPKESFTLLPYDGHLNAFGNKLIAKKLEEIINEFNAFSSRFKFVNRPVLLGDAPPNLDTIINWHKDLPFRLIINSQGLRANREYSFPKTKQRIVILGDSFSFGPYLPIDDTYPFLLEEEIDGRSEVINTSWPGYTIIDELSLFKEKSKYLEPDIVILQVLFNDVYGMSNIMLKIFSRVKERDFSLTKNELELVAEIISENNF
jgi:lysophospholipase L1-like esterase